MHNVSRSALVPHTSLQMFLLVDEAERYPEFLPWCTAAEVHFRQYNVTQATLELRKAGLRKRFTTRNKNDPGSSIEIALVDGPFKTLEGEWRFDQLSDAGSKVSLDLHFDFDSRITDRLLGPVFEEVCNSLVRAFTERAGIVYGP